MKTTKIARILQDERQRLHEDLEDSTPLQRIRTEAQIAEKADAFYPPEQREKDLKAIRTQIARLGEIIGYHSEQEEPL